MLSSVRLYLITDPQRIGCNLYFGKKRKSANSVSEHKKKINNNVCKWLTDKGRDSTPLTLHYSVVFQNMSNSLKYVNVQYAGQCKLVLSYD